MTTLHTPFPELLQRPDSDRSPWTIESGNPVRGDAWTNFTAHSMRVPRDDSPTSRVIRAHELSHAKFSPITDTPTIEELRARFGDQVLTVIEEARVNLLIERAGFDISLLHDGSEKPCGVRTATIGDWHGAVCFSVATYGCTSAHKDFIAGIRSVNKEWAKTLAVMVRAIKKAVPYIDLADQSLSEDGTPNGYVSTIKALGRIVFNTMYSQVNNDEERKRLNRSFTPGSRRPPSGRWATLVLDTSIALDTAVRAPLLRRGGAPSASGTRVAYPQRYLTDPRRRVFSAPRRSRGGVVVIDQSGSMDIGVKDLEEMLSLSPGLTVIGYSHSPGDVAGTPNAWVLARDGKRASVVRDGNVGNGVDLPVLEYAQSLRRSGEALVWVCDGQTTDSHDHPFGAEEVARFIRRHHVHTTSLVGLMKSLRGNQGDLMTMRMAEGRVGLADARR